MNKKICVVTTTRADYGILYPFIKLAINDAEYECQVVVSGTHLSQKFGYTINEIISDKIAIAQKINILTNEHQTTSEIFAKTIVEFAKSFEQLKPDLVVLLGDRFEILAVANVCLFLQIPVAHIGGGDVTFGAIDDACRHSITKIAKLHFVGNADMQKRVIAMGENPAYVFNFGELGIENIMNLKQKPIEEIETELSFKLKNQIFAIVTYHPVTTQPGQEICQIEHLMKALTEFSDMKFIITKANCDEGGEKINKYIEQFTKNYDNMLFIPSLGRQRYFSLLKNAKMVIGNSSSGILEVPYFDIPTVNIGHRQDGRMQSNSIFNCESNTNEIILTIKKAKMFSAKADRLYGNGDTASKILKEIKKFLTEDYKRNKIFYEGK